MKNKNKIFIDGDNLASQCFFGAKNLNSQRIFDTTLFLFFKKIQEFKETIKNSTIVFFFDSDRSYRAEKFPWYKQHKIELYKDEEKSTKKQIIDYLKEDALKIMGFQVFHQEGYEGDDLIAAYVSRDNFKNRIIIISTDEDLFQLLKIKVHIFNAVKNETFTKNRVIELFGISPCDFPIRKAFVGKKNEVPGFDKIGKVTAAKIIRKEIPFPNIDMNLFNDYLEVSILPFCNEERPIVVDEIKTFSGLRKDFKAIFEKHSINGFLKYAAFENWANLFKLR